MDSEQQVRRSGSGRSSKSRQSKIKEVLEIALRERQGTLVKSSVSGIDGKDLADHAEVSRGVDIVIGMSQKTVKEVREIKAALVLLEQGEYGICQECGEKIPADRLKSHPWATKCIDCQTKKEKNDQRMRR